MRLQKFKVKRPKVWKGLLSTTLCLLLASSSLFFSCQSPEKASDSKVQIQLSTWGSAEEVKVLRGILAEFEASHPGIHVDLLHIPDQYYQKLHILIAGGMAPDVIFTNSINFPVYAAHGVFRDLSPYLKQHDGIEEVDFFPQSLQAFVWRPSGQPPLLGAVPRDISNLVLYYNQDLFRKAQVPYPKPTWTWAAFLQSAKALTVDADQDGHPEQFGVSFYRTPPLFWLPFVWSAGGTLFSSDLKHLLLDQPQALAGLQFYGDLRNSAHVAPRLAETGGATMSQLFLQQKIAMMVSGRWSVPVLREQATFHWDVVPLPQGPGGSRVGIDASGYGISAQSPHPKESWALIRFLLSQRAMTQMAKSGLIVPARRDVAASEVFLSPGKAPAHGKAFIEVIPSGVPTQSTVRWNEFSEELGLALDPVWEGRETAQEAIRQAKPRLEKILSVGGPS